MTAEEQAKAVFTRFVEEGLNNKNMMGIADEILSPDLVIEAPGVPEAAGRANGKDIYIQSVLGFTSAFPDVQCSMPYLVANGNSVAADLAYHGTHLGDFLGVAPTNKHIHAGELWFCHVVDGKITYVRICEYGTPLMALLTA